MPSSSHLGELRLGLGQAYAADLVQEVDLGITNNVVDPRVTNTLPEGLNSVSLLHALVLALLAAVGGHFPVARIQGVHHGGEYLGLEFVG